MTALRRRASPILLLGFLTLTIAALAVITAEPAAAAGVADPADPRIVFQIDDELAVSDESLAVSFFIPAVFLIATAAVFIWAIGARARRSDDDRPMPWWRTTAWYSRREEEDVE